MIVLVLDEEEGRQVLARLLSSQAPQQRTCTCQQAVKPPAPEEGEGRPTQSWRPWTPEEDAPLLGCAAPLQARKAYRRVFPQSDRTNAAIKARYLALKKDRKLAGESDAITADLRDECSAEQIEDEIEATGEPAGPVDSEIAAEMEEDKPLPLHTRVRLLLQGSKYCGCEAEIVRQTGNPDEYVVVPDGAVARFPVTRKDLEVLP